MHEYDLIADWYASERDGRTGVPEVKALASSLQPGSRILDIGCGNGIPITRAILDAGHSVVGLDSSSRMLERFRRNCPEAEAIYGTIQECQLAESSFDAAIALGVLFHLSPDEQVKAIRRVGALLRPRATFLFTAGDVDGFEPKEDTMNGVTFQYYSFSVENYRRLLHEAGFSLIGAHQDEGQNTYYFAKKP